MLLVGCFVSRKVSVNDGVDNHDDNDDVEGVEKPVVNHFVICSFWYHLHNGTLNRCNHHHDGN